MVPKTIECIRILYTLSIRNYLTLKEKKEFYLKVILESSDFDKLVIKMLIKWSLLDCSTCDSSYGINTTWFSSNLFIVFFFYLSNLNITKILCNLCVFITHQFPISTYIHVISTTNVKFSKVFVIISLCVLSNAILNKYWWEKSIVFRLWLFNIGFPRFKRWMFNLWKY